jgi:ubiquinone/menaquinone biosynthesis C-methylase UbiE
MKEENPFENEQEAKKWILSVEDTSGQNNLREKEMYPLLESRAVEYQAKDILEIGAGQGICSTHIGESFNSYTGIEPSETLVGRAQEKYADSKKQFVVGNAYELPVESNSFDFVFSTMVWFHLANPERASTELARVLEPNGHFLIVTANPNSYKIWESFFDNPIVDDKHMVGMVHIPGGVVSKNIIYKHTQERLLSALESANLKISSVKELGYVNGLADKSIFISIEGTK